MFFENISIIDNTPSRQEIKRVLATTGREGEPKRTSRRECLLGASRMQYEQLCDETGSFLEATDTGTLANCHRQMESMESLKCLSVLQKLNL